jgi:hypothetical protein
LTGLGPADNLVAVSESASATVSSVLVDVGNETRKRIEEEIAEGKLGIARDRLHGLVLAYPDDMKLRSRLGDVYAKLGYPAEAGRFWFLDAELDDEKRAAIDAFILRCDSNPSNILRRLKIRCSPEVLTTAHARERVAQLVQDCEKRGYKVPTFGPTRDFVPARSNWWLSFGCSLLAFVLITLLVVGAFTVWKKVFG